MPEPENEAASSEAVQKQLEILDQFENHRRTWELELLISGAVVFALLGVPARIDEWFFSLNIHISRTQFTPLFYGYFYLKMIAYSLIGTFCVNLTLRAYWIGLIGLNKVFPDGIRWSEVKEGPISLKISRGFPSIPQLTESADKIGSLVFSSSFIIVFINLFSILLIAAITLIAFLISAALGGKYFGGLFFTLVMITFLLPAVVLLIDKGLAKKPQEAWEGRWFVKPIHYILKSFYWITMRPLGSSIQLTLGSNINRKLSMPLFIGALVLLFAIFMGSLILQSSYRLPFHGYLFLPDVNVERGVDFGHYEDMRPKGKIYRRYPSIQSDIITEPFIRLFIPYSPRDNKDLMTHCPDTEPVPQQGFTLKKTGRNILPPTETIDAALECLGSFQRIFINGTPLDPEFDFFDQPDNGVRGIITYLSVDGLPKGRNFLRIVRAEDKSSDPEDEEPPIEFFIPFWI